MKNLIHEIHRRSLWQVLSIYVVGGWVALTAVDTLQAILKLPEWTPSFALVLLLIGLPIVLATAFVQEGIGSKDPAQDLPTDEQVSAEAEQDASEPAPLPAVHHRVLTWRNLAFGAVGAFLVLFGFAGLYVVLQDRGRSFVPAEATAVEPDPGIAFLPFEVSGPELENLREVEAGSSWGALWAGVFAASEGRWSDYEAMRTLLQARLDESRSSGESGADYQAYLSFVDGYGLWQRGELERAAEVLEGLPERYRVASFRWLLGRINLDLQRPEAAARYFLAVRRWGYVWPWTRAFYYLGQAYEQMGDLEKAQQAYADYLDAWKDADPELQPLVEQGRERLAAILAERG